MIAIIDYNAGNIASVGNALTRLHADFKITSDPDEIRQADKIIFPGVGRARAAMEQLKKRDLVSVIKNATQPFLGICLGLQLLGEFSEEDNTECLGIIPAKVRRFPATLTVPQMGWNRVSKMKDSPLFSGIPDESYFYFVNSYYMELSEYTIGKAVYSKPFSAAVQKDNFFATQFHPEKSGEIGLKVLENFLKC